MNLDRAQDIIDGYASWWRNEVVASQAGSAIQLVCPMLNRNNDHMSFYIADDPSQPGGFLLTDMGVTLGDLAFSGCDILGSESRSRKLEQTLNTLGIQLSGEELCAKADEKTLFTQMNMLMQGMASVDDLFFTAKDSVRGFFAEDVASWFDERGIRYTDNLLLSGKSGFKTKFDFAIPKTKSIAPERLVKTIGNPIESNVKNALFGWNDIQSVRAGSRLYIFLNDTTSNVSAGIKQACAAYDTVPVPWSEAGRFVEELAA